MVEVIEGGWRWRGGRELGCGSEEGKSRKRRKGKRMWEKRMTEDAV